MCICLNCFRIVNCNIYSSIAEKHAERLSLDFLLSQSFFPQSPVIFTILSPSLKRNFLLEWDVNECLSYQEQPGSWLNTATKFNKKNTNQNLSYLTYDGLFESKKKVYLS